jgi:hypothetical protein
MAVEVGGGDQQGQVYRITSDYQCRKSQWILGSLLQSFYFNLDIKIAFLYWSIFGLSLSEHLHGP